MHCDGACCNLCLSLRLTCRLLASVGLAGRAAQVVEFTAQLASSVAQVLFLRTELIENSHEVLLREPLKRIRALCAHLSRQGKSKNHEDHEHHDVESTGKREECLASARPQTGVDAFLAMGAVRPSAFLSSLVA